MSREQAKTELEKVCGSVFASLPAKVIDALIDWKVEGKVPEDAKPAEPAAADKPLPSKEDAAPPAAGAQKPADTPKGDPDLYKVYLDAKDALGKCESNDIEELAVMITPPPDVGSTFATVSAVCGSSTEWATIKMTYLVDGATPLKEAIEKLDLSAGMVDIVKDYCAKTDTKDVARSSWVASVYSHWIHSLHKYCVSLSADTAAPASEVPAAAPTKESATPPEEEADENALVGNFELVVKSKSGDVLKTIEKADLSMTRGHLVPKLEEAVPTHVWTFSTDKGPLKGPATLSDVGLSGDKGEITAEKVETKLFKPYFAARGQILKSNGNDMNEAGGMKKLPPGMQETMRVAFAIVGHPNSDDWDACRPEMQNKGEGFKERLKKFQADKAPHKIVELLKPYVENPEYDSRKLAMSSMLAGTVCPWIASLYKYSESLC